MFDQFDITTWFHHGILDINTGVRTDDPNYLGLMFEDVFERKWGVKPSGELYDAYNMIRSWRDALQKALWVNKGNPNLERLRLACKQMVENSESMEILQKRIGKYEWIIGEEGNQTVRTLHSFITEDSLRTLIRFNTEALGLKPIFKPEMLDRR